jgi:PIN domain nuclease of toxin-antitoxin system
MLLLDTHAWIWLFDRDPRIRSCVNDIEAAASQGELGIAAISVWEIAMLESKSRLELKFDVLTWVRRALNVPGLTLVPLSPEVAVESTRLPGSFHNDPADRIIVATARVLNATLVTKDEQILAYGKQGAVKVLPV